jgi:hypothetical protein
MKTVASFFMLILFSGNAFSQSSAEVTCRAKAKEIAVQTYSSCVTEARQAQVEEIRASYQKELSALKSKYDKELKKLANNKSTAMAEPLTVKEIKSAKSSKKASVAKVLPGKTQKSSDAAPVQTVSEEPAVVAVGSENEAKSVEKEASEAPQVEISEVPAE